MKTPTPDIKEMAQECDEIVDNLINAMNMSLTFDDKEKAQGMRYHIATIFVSRIFVKAANGNIDTLIALNGDLISVVRKGYQHTSALIVRCSRG